MVDGDGCRLSRLVVAVVWKKGGSQMCILEFGADVFVVCRIGIEGSTLFAGTGLIR